LNTAVCGEVAPIVHVRLESAERTVIESSLRFVIVPVTPEVEVPTLTSFRFAPPVLTIVKSTPSTQPMRTWLPTWNEPTAGEPGAILQVRLLFPCTVIECAVRRWMTPALDAVVADAERDGDELAASATAVANPSRNSGRSRSRLMGEMIGAGATGHQPPERCIERMISKEVPLRARF
jgi:hypothetical protein